MNLIIGASGQVGGVLLRALGTGACGTFSSHALPGLRALDIRRPKEVDALVDEFHPDVIFLCAAVTDVDWCEAHAEESAATNVDGLTYVGRAAKRVGANLVLFSTDYVFDGESGPYRETDRTNPICVYGKQKLLAEQVVPDALIIRTNGVYGWETQAKNFVCRLIDTLRAGRRMRVASDQFGSPTYAPDLAKTVLQLTGSSGIFHVAGSEQMSRFEFAREAARVFDLDENLIEAVPTRALNQIAPRPLKAGLITGKLKSALSGGREGLRLMAQAGR
jgi:dTDP-4-dehydrorhamnose reductase